MKSRMTIAAFDPGKIHRTHQWIDTTTLEPKYGIQQHYPDLQVWAHAHHRGAMLIFDTKDEARAFIKSAELSHVGQG